MTATRQSPNRALLVRVARSVRPVLDELTFVGGNVAELLVTDPLSVRIRQTDDVDVIVAATTRLQYAQLEDRLRSLGLRHDNREGAPICRWLTPEGLKLDVMPVEGAVLQFANSWYAEAIASAWSTTLEPGLVIRVVAAPEFLATKWEAYQGRGGGDLLGSHDVEDIVAVVAGRRSIVAELASAPSAVRNWVSKMSREFLAVGESDYAIEGALPDARLDPAIAQEARARFIAIAGLGS